MAKPTSKPNAADTELASALLETVTKALVSLRSECRNQNRGSGLTMVQLRALNILYMQESTNRDLSEEIGLSVAAMSRLLQTLFDQGLVRRRENPTDRRESFVQITASGKTILKRFQEVTCSHYAERFAKLSAADKKTIAHALELIAGEVLS